LFSKNRDWDLLYRSLNAKLRMTKGRERLRIASEMSTTAEKLDKKNTLRFEALYYLGVVSPLSHHTLSECHMTASHFRSRFALIV